MNRCSFCEWIPILPWPLWPLAGQFSLGQNVVVGSMTLLLAVRGKHCHEKYVWTPVCFTTAPYHGLVWSYPVVQGEALITLNNVELQCAPGEAIDIPREAWHRLANPGTSDLVVIEVQCGDYLGEDDIVRRQDNYGRAKTTAVCVDG